MTGIDELLREVLAEDANTQLVGSDLVARSMRAGRSVRRRRHVGIVSVSVASVAGLVLGSLAIAGSIGGSGDQMITPAHQPSHPRIVTDESNGAWWTWPTDRVYGAKPSDAFFATANQDAAPTVYASGTMSDGTNFELTVDGSSSPHAPSYTQGWDNEPDFGQAAVQGPATGTGADYVAVESPTRDAHDNGGRSQWLILITKPGTTAASFSPNGQGWQPMDVQHGIAVIKLSTQTVKDVSPSPGHPSPAWISLSDSSGVYSQAPAQIE